MDPNQAPATPPTPIEPVTPQPMVPGVPPVMPVAQPAPTPFAAQPPQSVASTEVFGSSPQSISSAPLPYAPQGKSSKKIVIIIAAIVVGLGVLGTAGWLLFGILTGNSITLKEYSGDKFSLLVPEKYEQDILSSSATFTEPDSKSVEDESKILVQRGGSVIGDRDKYIEIIDSSLNEDKLNAGIDNGASIANMKVVKSTKGDQAIRTITADVKKDGAVVGAIRYLFIIAEDDVYVVVVAAHLSDPALAANAQKITDSFKLK